MKNAAVCVLLALLVVSAFLVLSPVPSSAVGPGKVLIWQGGGAGQVVFSGSEHAEKGYVCNDCHTKLFKTKKGASTMSMAAMNKGESCGACHNGKTAFSTDDKAKCHECHGKQHKHHKGHGEKHEENGKHKKHHED